MWLHFFEEFPELAHLPLAERRKAAYFAQRRAFRHWQVWLALLFLIAIIIGLAFLTITFTSDRNGTSGAFVGFCIGIATLNWTVYHFGLPYYRHALVVDETMPSGRTSDQAAASDT